MLLQLTRSSCVDEDMQLSWHIIMQWQGMSMVDSILHINDKIGNLAIKW